MALLILLLVLLLLYIIVMPFVAFFKSRNTEQELQNLTTKVSLLEGQLRKLQLAKSQEVPKQETTPVPSPEPVKPSPAAPVIPPSPELEKKIPTPKPAEKPSPVENNLEEYLRKQSPKIPQTATAPNPARPNRQETKPAQSPINWEQFMGAKLFAWIGGLALFLGIAFFVKYSFEHNLVPPEVRVAIGYLCGIGLLAGGVLMKRKETAVTAQTLCSTGVLILYAATFASHAYYHFAFFTTVPTFLLMSLITIIAFLLSIRMNALVVAILGIAGGFLTPVLLSTGKDAPLALFSYIGLLDLGLLAVARKRSWTSLPILGAVGTIIMQIGWISRFFISEQYFNDNKIFITMTVLIAFQVLFLAATAWGKRLDRLNTSLPASALAVGIVAFMSVFFFLNFPSLGNRPVLLLGYACVANIALLLLGFFEKQIGRLVPPVIGLISFIFLARWTHQYFNIEHLYPALAFYLVFAALNLVAPVVMQRITKTTPLPWWCFTIPVFLLPFYYLSIPILAERPVLLFGTIFIVGILLLILSLMDKMFTQAEAAAGSMIFLMLGIWTGKYLSEETLYVALGLYFVFALLYAGSPIVFKKWRGASIPWWSNAFPSLTLLLLFVPIFKIASLSTLIWPLVLFVDVLAIILAVVTAAMLPILLILVLTLAVTGAWIFRIPSDLTGLPTTLFIIGGFAIFFIAAAAWACRKFSTDTSHTSNLFGETNNSNLSVQIPGLSATLPFLLLIMLTARLSLVNPSPIFGLALLLVVLILGLSKIMRIESLTLVGLGCILALEHAWHFRTFNPEYPSLPLLWYLIFYAIFTVFPFVFHKQHARSTLPWIASALAGPLHFYLVYHLIHSSYPGVIPVIGLVPALFSIPSIIGLTLILKRTPMDSPSRNTQLALFGGVTLLFITLIFPIQFDRQWITIGWALEGAALCWLFKRIPHPGLRITGVALGIAAFARLAFNPAVLSYHSRLEMPILNWYLYAYGVVTACLFLTAWLLPPPRHRLGNFNIPPLFCALGTVLLFLLVNIEIADFFSEPGTPVLTFQFSGNFARDMSYSIAWALFSLMLLVIGIIKRIPAARYASIALLAVTLLKLFFHDLSQLDQLYRIGAFIVVAIIAIIASFLYQRFLNSPETHNETPIPPAE